MFGISYGVPGDDFEIRFVSLFCASDVFMWLELNVAETLSGMVGVVLVGLLSVGLDCLWEYLGDFDCKPMV